MIKGFRVEITSLSSVPGRGIARCPGLVDGRVIELHGWFRRPDGRVVGFFKQPGMAGSRDRLGNRDYHAASYYIALIEPIVFPTDPPEALMDVPMVPRESIEGDYRIVKILREAEPGKSWRRAEHDFEMSLRHLAYEHVGAELVQPRRGRHGRYEVPLVETRKA